MGMPSFQSGLFFVNDNQKENLNIRQYEMYHEETTRKERDMEEATTSSEGSDRAPRRVLKNLSKKDNTCSKGER